MILKHTYNRQLFLLVLCLVGTVVFFEITPIDILVQRWFFDADLNDWIISRDQRWLRFVLYDGVKTVYFGVVIIFLLLSLSPRFTRIDLFLPRHKYYDQQKLRVVLVSLVLVPLAVNLLKDATNIPCPRDLALFGGSYPHITLFRGYPDDFVQVKRIACYPAGHASGGFALMALGILGKTRKAKRVIVSMACLLGWVVGVYKIIIGDHFLGHTVVTMLLAMIIILLVDRGLRLRSSHPSMPNLKSTDQRDKATD